MSNTSIICDLIHNVVAFAISQECQIENASQRKLQSRFVVVDHAMKNGKETVLLNDFLST